MCVCAQSCPTLCDPMDYSPPGSIVHGILQVRILSGEQFPSSGDLPNPGVEPRSPALQADSLPAEQSGKLKVFKENSERDGNTRPPYLPPEKPVWKSRSNS